MGRIGHDRVCLGCKMYIGCISGALQGVTSWHVNDCSVAMHAACISSLYTYNQTYAWGGREREREREGTSSHKVLGLARPGGDLWRSLQVSLLCTPRLGYRALHLYRIASDRFARARLMRASFAPAAPSLCLLSGFPGHSSRQWPRACRTVSIA